MDFHLLLQVIVGLLATAFTCTWWVVSAATNRSKRREAPQPPWALPFIGHLHLLRNKDLPLSRTLATMADKYGPVFMLRLGTHRMLVISSCEAARECFAAKDRALASRPSFAAAKHMGYDYAMFGFAPYGPYWRWVRKLATTELLSNARVAAFEHVRSAEVDARIRELYNLWEEKGRRAVVVDMTQWFKDLSFGIIVRVVAGKRCSDAGGVSDEVALLKHGMEQFFRLVGALVPSDLFPFLGWVGLGRHEKAMQSAANDMDAAVAAWLEEHRSSRKSTGKSVGTAPDFMDVMLSAMDGDATASEHDADKVIKATCVGMILGGNDTTSMSLTKNLAVLLNYPQVLRRAQEELDLHVGRGRNVEEADVKNLVYLQAVVKETFRLHPTAEIPLTHEATEDCDVAGFHVPAGTRVLANIWKLQRDPTVWPDPTKFKPERFLGSSAHVDVKGQHFELIPFGAGRRMCPGVSFALHLMHLTLARLIHSFDLWAPPSDGAPLEIEDFRVGTAPLEVALSPRLPPELY